MARYEHLPIFTAAYDLALATEQVVARFSRLHKYGLGTDLRQRMHGILGLIVNANTSRDRLPLLLRLRDDLELCKIIIRLCHDAGGFPSTAAYQQLSVGLVGIAQQNEGWIASMRNRQRRQDGPAPEEATA
jgi:hypothetical protein